MMIIDGRELSEKEERYIVSLLKKGISRRRIAGRGGFLWNVVKAVADANRQEIRKARREHDRVEFDVAERARECLKLSLAERRLAGLKGRVD